MRLAVVAITSLVITGCASADPAAWKLYSRGAYLYGRIEAKAEMVCQGARHPALVEFCAEAGRTQVFIKETAPTIEAELSRDRVDWPTLWRYLDAVLGLAAKAL